LQKELGSEDFVVLAFPCNQFGAQEPGTDEEVLEFARSNYDVNFPMFSKIEVNGEGAAELYRYLREQAPNEDGTSDIPWNFTKFLVDREGNVTARYSPVVTPDDLRVPIADLL
jgi:glutathione peroxidase